MIEHQTAASRNAMSPPPYLFVRGWKLNLPVRPTRDYVDIRPDILPENSMVGVEICSRSWGYMLKFCRILAQAGILSLKVLCGMAGCRSPQADRAVHHGCRPFEKRGEMRVPARSRTSATGTHERSIGAGSHGERPALESTQR